MARKPAGDELLDGVREWCGVADKEQEILANERARTGDMGSLTPQGAWRRAGHGRDLGSSNATCGDQSSPGSFFGFSVTITARSEAGLRPLTYGGVRLRRRRFPRDRLHKPQLARKLASSYSAPLTRNDVIDLIRLALAARQTQLALEVVALEDTVTDRAPRPRAGVELACTPPQGSPPLALVRRRSQSGAGRRCDDPVGFPPRGRCGCVFSVPEMWRRVNLGPSRA
jgi:hypothetical protein